VYTPVLLGRPSPLFKVLMTAALTPVPKIQFFANDGTPLVGGKLYSYAAGTTTPLATYTTYAGTVANTNPVILDSRGEADVWLGSALYKMALYDADDALIWTVDNISSINSGIFTGPVSGTTGTFSGALTAASGTFSGPVSGTTGTFSSGVSGTTGAFSSAVSGTTGAFSSTLNVTGVSTLTAGAVAQGLTVGKGSGITSSNTAFGISALEANTNSGANTALGFETLKVNLTGASNTAVGHQALEFNTASSNTAVGASSLLLNTTGASNTACGGGSLSANLIGLSNAALGANALLVSTSDSNTAVGATALSTLTTGSNNTGVGFNAQPSTATVSNTITLGNSSIATLRCQVTTITALSDQRDKKDIVDIPAGLDFVQALRPVAFMWNMRDGGKIDVPEFGFIAQELQAAQETTGITVPNLVSLENPERLEASQSTLLPVLVKAIQELKAELDALKMVGEA
jgi:hypothetical protein